MEQRTIRITGEGSKKFKPDQTKISLIYKSVLPTYDEALEKAAEYTRLIKAKALEAGAEEGSVRTSSFDVSADYDSYTDKEGNRHSRFNGYAAEVDFTITVPFDNKLLSKVLFALKDYAGKFRLSYSLKDREKAKEEVTALAVASARKKAELLASAAGEKLGELLSIDYSYGRVEVDYGYREDLCCSITNKFSEAPQMEIDPEDLTVSDTVNIVWALA